MRDRGCQSPVSLCNHCSLSLSKKVNNCCLCQFFKSPITGLGRDGIGTNDKIRNIFSCLPIKGDSEVEEGWKNYCDYTKWSFDCDGIFLSRRCPRVRDSSQTKQDGARASSEQMTKYPKVEEKKTTLISVSQPFLTN